MNSEFKTVKEVVALTNLSRATIYRYCDKPSFKKYLKPNSKIKLISQAGIDFILEDSQKESDRNAEKTSRNNDFDTKSHENSQRKDEKRRPWWKFW